MCRVLFQMQVRTRPWFRQRSSITALQVAIQRSEAMAPLRQSVLLVASAFLVLQLTELVAATTGLASYYTGSYLPTACFGFDPTKLPANNLFAAGGDSAGHNVWNNGANCGKFFTIECKGDGCNGHGAISVQIVDHCAGGCGGGRAFDLSETAFGTIANLDVGVITVEYSPASSHDGEDAAKETFIAEVGHGGQ